MSTTNPGSQHFVLGITTHHHNSSSAVVVEEAAAELARQLVASGSVLSFAYA